MMMGATLTMRKTYFSSVAMTRVSVPELSGTQAPSVLFTSAVQGSGISFLMNMVFTGKDILTEVHKFSYLKTERYKIFQKKNIISTKTDKELNDVPNVKDVDLQYYKDI